FRFDVTTRPTSPWNRSAARVFATITIRNANLPFTYDMRLTVERAFAAHLERIFRRRQDSEKGQAHLMSKAARAHRGMLADLFSQLFLQRHEVAHRFSELHDHIPMLEELGRDAMSVDESVQDGSSVGYRVSSLEWRDGKVEQWLRHLDIINAESRKDQGRHIGAQPRARDLTGPRNAHTSRRVVLNLPIDSYNPNWLRRNPQRHDDLLPSAEPYSFDVTLGITKCVPACCLLNVLVLIIHFHSLVASFT
ncbi:hypothetical protein FB45DRAFT_739537, partial [Roridomyces roridus]